MCAAPLDCPICMCSITSTYAQPPDCCHRYHTDCLKSWASKRSCCPLCRVEFSELKLYSYDEHSGESSYIGMESIEPVKELQLDDDHLLDLLVENTNCDICGGGADEDLILLCDRCDRGFHTYCLTPALPDVPTEPEWFCHSCSPRVLAMQQQIRRQPRITTPFIRRTALAVNVRENIRRRNTAEQGRLTRSMQPELMELSDTYEDDEDTVHSKRRILPHDESMNSDDDEGEDEDDSSTGSSNDDEDEEQANTMDDYVLQDEPSTSSLPSVARQRRKRKTKSKSKKSKTRKGSKKSRRAKKRSSQSPTKGPRAEKREPLPRLSLNGAGGFDPVFDELDLTSEGSKNFYRPLFPVEPRRATPAKDKEDPNAAFDVLGTILKNQTEAIAPGHLFKNQNGRLEPSEEFDSYKAKTENKLSSELRESIQRSDPAKESGSNLDSTSSEKQDKQYKSVLEEPVRMVTCHVSRPLSATPIRQAPVQIPLNPQPVEPPQTIEPFFAVPADPQPSGRTAAKAQPGQSGKSHLLPNKTPEGQKKPDVRANGTQADKASSSKLKSHSSGSASSSQRPSKSNVDPRQSKSVLKEKKAKEQMEKVDKIGRDVFKKAYKRKQLSKDQFKNGLRQLWTNVKKMDPINTAVITKEAVTILKGLIKP